MVALWATKARFNSFENELSNGHPEMVQKGPAHLGDQWVHPNGL
jgi:hypothetical protein